MPLGRRKEDRMWTLAYEKARSGHYGGAHGLRCWQAHGERRRSDAEAALAALGVKP